MAPDPPDDPPRDPPPDPNPDDVDCHGFCADLETSCPGGEMNTSDQPEGETCVDICGQLLDHFGVESLDCIRGNFEKEGQAHCVDDGPGPLFEGCITICELDSQCEGDLICEHPFCVEGSRTACGSFVQCFKEAHDSDNDDNDDPPPPGDNGRDRLRQCFDQVPADGSNIRNGVVRVIGCQELCEDDGDGNRPGAPACGSMDCDGALDQCNDDNVEVSAPECGHVLGCMLHVCTNLGEPCFQFCGTASGDDWAPVATCIRTQCMEQNMLDPRECLGGICADVARGCGVDLPPAGGPQPSGCELIYNCVGDCPGDDRECPMRCLNGTDPETQRLHQDLQGCASDNRCGYRQFDCLDDKCGDQKRACFGGHNVPNEGDPPDPG